MLLYNSFRAINFWPKLRKFFIHLYMLYFIIILNSESWLHSRGGLFCNFKIVLFKPPFFIRNVGYFKVCFRISDYKPFQVWLFRNLVIYWCYCKVLNRYQLRNASHRARLSGFGRELFKNSTFIDSNFIAYFRAVFLEHYHVPLQTLEKNER